MGVGVGLVSLGSVSTKYNENDDTEKMTAAGSAMYIAGWTLLATMSGMFATGIIFDYISDSNLKKAEYSEQMIQYYKARSKSVLSSLRFDLVINPLNRSVGGKLAFNF